MTVKSPVIVSDGLTVGYVAATDKNRFYLRLIYSI